MQLYVIADTCSLLNVLLKALELEEVQHWEYSFTAVADQYPLEPIQTFDQPCCQRTDSYTRESNSSVKGFKMSVCKK